ncbi:MAG: ABC transporter ATP-binding protein, partial [Elusimicrobiales bacterium]|nr:ABC transporter ATP-binding protein [Elusimicrobiales bacterium]
TKNLSNFILKNVNLTIKDGEIFALLGPNGAGKTTLLNTISGLISYDGSIFFNGEAIDKLPAEKRGVGYLFQDLCLFPHVTVLENVAYPLKTKIKANKTAAKEKAAEILKSMNLFADLYPTRLSGGEKQKIAIARALSSKPRILLLDEPFKSIDLNTAAYLREELKNLLKEFKITAIYVTHSFFQAEEMADRLGILIDGRLLHIGGARDIFFDSHDNEVSDFIGSPNILNIDSLKALGTGLFEAECGGMNIIVPHWGKPAGKLAILSKDIRISPRNGGATKLNQFEGDIIDILHCDSHFKIKIAAKKNILFSEISKTVFDGFKIKAGDKVNIMLNLNGIRMN